MNWIDRVSDALTYFALFIALTLAYPSRFSGFKTACLLLLFTADAAGMALLLEMLPAGNLIVSLFCFVLWGWVYAALVLTEPFPYKMAMASVFVSTGMFLSLLTRYLISLVAPGFGAMYSRLFSIPLLFLSGLILKKNAIHSQRKAPADCYFSISFVALLGLLAYDILQSMLYRNNQLAAVILSICFLAVLYTVFWLSSRLIVRYDADMMKLSLETGSQGEQQAAESVLRLTNDIRSQHVETRNHLAALAVLLDEGETQEARQWLTEQIDAPIPDGLVNSGSAAADEILNLKAAQARMLNIPMSIDASLTEPLPIQTADLTALLGHLLNNALEASRKIEAPEIAVRVFSADDSVCFLVRNRADAKALRNNPQLATTKENPETHGFGLKIIRAIAEKYDGQAVFKMEGDFFVARVTLPLDS